MKRDKYETFDCQTDVTKGMILVSWRTTQHHHRRILFFLPRMCVVKHNCVNQETASSSAECSRRSVLSEDSIQRSLIKQNFLEWHK